MPFVSVTINHTFGSVSTELPDDVLIGTIKQDLAPRLGFSQTETSAGRLEYSLECQRLGRLLQDNETLRDAGVQQEDTLLFTYKIQVLSAGNQSNQLSPTDSFIGLTLENLETLEFKHIFGNEIATKMLLHSHRTTIADLKQYRQSLDEANNKIRQLENKLKDKNIATLLLVLGQVLTGFATNLITNNSSGGWLVFSAGLLLTFAGLYFSIFGLEMPSVTKFRE